MLENVTEFFISSAYAEGPAADASGDPGVMGFLPLIIIFILFYFLLIRPQAKKAKQHKGMVAALAKGDEIVTNGGLLGKTTKIDDGFISVEISDGIIVQVQRNSIATLVPKGTYKGKGDSKAKDKPKDKPKDKSKDKDKDKDTDTDKDKSTD